MWIIAILVVIMFILLFGPVVTGLVALAAALGLGLWGAGLLFLFGLFVFVVLGGAVGWCIWWVFDRPGAMASLRSEQAAHDRKMKR